MEDIIIVDNNLKPEDFIRLRLEAGFMETPMEQAEKALANGLFTASALCGDKMVGMGRLIGDGAMYWYIQDVAVMPAYQGRGIGKAIVTRLISYAEANSLPGSKASIGLIAAKGKEPFYEKMGFAKHPHDISGAGMTRKFIAPGNEPKPNGLGLGNGR